MRYITILILSILWVLNSYAQEFGTHWISYPLPNDSSEVWFRKTYTLSHLPIQAQMTLASTGNYKLYINERNVTGSMMFEGIRDSIILSRTINVTRYLRQGENVIAVWYAPQGKNYHDKQGRSIHGKQGRPSHGKQLSLELYGWTQDSLPFYHKADGSWLCRQLKDCSNGESERFDARTNILEWKSDEYRPHGWFHPVGSMTAESEPLKDNKVIKAENQLYKVLKPVGTYTDSLGFNIDFGRPFRGTIRLTLRGAHKGEKININHYQYTCNGELDEQAFCRFSYQKQRIYTITWRGRFKKSDIVHIEGLEISE